MRLPGVRTRSGVALLLVVVFGTLRAPGARDSFRTFALKYTCACTPLPLIHFLTRRDRRRTRVPPRRIFELRLLSR